MAPSAESVTSTVDYDTTRTTTTNGIDSGPSQEEQLRQQQQLRQQPIQHEFQPPPRNIAHAVNYEPSMVDRYWQKSFKTTTSRVKSLPRSTTPTTHQVLSTTTTTPTTTLISSSSSMANQITNNRLNTTSSSSCDSNSNNNNSNSCRRGSNLENSAPNVPHEVEPNIRVSEKVDFKKEHDKVDSKRVILHTPDKCSSSKLSSHTAPIERGTRRSNREQKKREVTLVSTRVRYDMELVPHVQRNRKFLQQFASWPIVRPPRPISPPPTSPTTPQEERTQVPETKTASSTTTTTLEDMPKLEQEPQQQLKEQQQPQQEQQQQPQQEQQTSSSRDTQSDATGPCQSSSTSRISSSSSFSCTNEDRNDATEFEKEDITTCCAACSSNDVNSASDMTEATSPFVGENSVVWIPSNRSQWNDSVLEMTAVCTSAALRKHKGDKPFLPPLSKDYIRDRIDIDDPLNGYQLRHPTGGWLQGFILWTNFTTWTHDFKWDSLHQASGMTRTMTTDPVAVPNDMEDTDGSLARQLEEQPRYGDPSETGIVFETIAEIALLGGLGCGEYLLRMALDSIRQHKKYKYVVLQATDGSRSFYERFNFRRVGAICRYGSKDAPTDVPSPHSPIRGYRHWTHPNESERSLEMHGGPSYMMCLELPDESSLDCPSCGEQQSSFLQAMMAYQVKEKPCIQQLGATSTPTTKKTKMRSRNSLNNSNNLGSSPKPQNSNPTVPRIQHTPTLSARSQLTSPEITLHAPGVVPVNTTPVQPNSETSKITKPFVGSSRGLQNRSSVSTPTGPSTRPKRVYTTLDSDIQGEKNNSNKRRKVEDQSSSISPRDHLLTRPPDGEQLTYAQKQYHSVWLAVPPQERQPARRAPRDRNSTTATPTPTIRKTRSDSTPTTAITSRPSNGRSRKTTKRNGSSTPNRAREHSPVTNVRPRTIRRNSEKVKADFEVKTSSRKNIQVNNGSGGINRVDRATLVKQKVKSYPRDRIHFYNKVVQRKKTVDDKNKDQPHMYFFVLNYNEPNGIIKIVPMEARGELSGKRQGRPRFQAMIESTDRNFLTVSTADYEPVAAFMVMKTPNVANEAWDILGA